MALGKRPPMLFWIREGLFVLSFRCGASLQSLFLSTVTAGLLGSHPEATLVRHLAASRAERTRSKLACSLLPSSLPAGVSVTTRKFGCWRIRPLNAPWGRSVAWACLGAPSGGWMGTCSLSFVLIIFLKSRHKPLLRPAPPS